MGSFEFCSRSVSAGEILGFERAELGERALVGPRPKAKGFGGLNI